MDLRYEFTGTNRLVAYLRDLPDQAKGRVAGIVETMVLKIRQAAYEKLSGPVLALGSGKLRSSLKSEVTSDGAGTMGRLLVAGVPYARIQEYGGRTSPHDILPVNAKALAFMSPGKLPISKPGSSSMVFAKVVHHPGSLMPERSYLRAALAENRAEFLARLKGIAGGNSNQ